MYCPECSTEIPDNAKFCFKCRYDLSRLKTLPLRKASSDPLDDIETSMGQEIETSSFSKGSLFANRYEILDDGKKGGMGAVYKCKDTKLNKIVALKIIHPRLLSSNQALSRFRQEVSISQELQHPNIVKVFNLEEWDDKEYFTMEWVDGVTLREVIVKRKAENIPFRIDEAYKIISQLADALNHAHKYTIHRDIKPENILVTDEKEFTVKLTDFGIAKMLSPSQYTSTSMQMGTPYYMAPEQKLDAGNVDKRADIYALGVVLFELLTLSNTIGLKLPSQIIKDIPKEIDDLLVKALEEEPENRYRDANEFSDLLGQIVAGSGRKAEEAKLREAEEEKSRKAEAERKRREIGETEKKRQDADQQKAAAEERAQAEGQRIRQEQTRKEEETRRQRIQEVPQNKKNPMLMVGIVIAAIIGIFIYNQQSRTGQTPEVTETLVSAAAPAPAPMPKPEPKPVVQTASSQPTADPISATAPVPEKTKEEPSAEEERLAHAKLRTNDQAMVPTQWRKICPVDGEVWADSANFCGKHGVKLKREAVASLPLPSDGSDSNLVSKQGNVEKDVSNKRFAVQIAIFKELSTAETLKESFQRKGYEAFTQKGTTDKRTFYQVLIGDFENRKEASRLAAQIETKEKIKTTIFSAGTK